MSQSELERFAASVQATPALLDAYKDAVVPEDLATLLRRDGYDVTDAEIAEVSERGRELSDDQLDQVTGGDLGLVVGGLTAIAAVGVLGTVAVLGIIGRVQAVPPGAS